MKLSTFQYTEDGIGWMLSTRTNGELQLTLHSPEDHYIITCTDIAFFDESIVTVDLFNEYMDHVRNLEPGFLAVHVGA